MTVHHKDTYVGGVGGEDPGQQRPDDLAEYWNIMGGTASPVTGEAAQSAFDPTVAETGPQPLPATEGTIGAAALQGTGARSAAPLPGPRLENPFANKKTGPGNRKRTIALSIGAGALVLAVGIPAGVFAYANSQVNKGVAAEASQHPVGTNGSAAAETPPDTEVLSRGLDAPTAISSQPEPGGRLHTNRPFKGLQSDTVAFGGQDISLPPILAPDSEYGSDLDQTNTNAMAANQLLANLSYLLSADTNTADYGTIMRKFTDNPDLVPYITQKNGVIASRYPNSQVIIFDTEDNPAIIQEGKLNADNFRTLRVTALMRVLSSAEGSLATFGDSSACAPGDAAPVTFTFSFGTKPKDDGLHAVVEGMDIQVGTDGNGVEPSKSYPRWFPIDMQQANLVQGDFD
jgi:hypothetical protein